MAVTDHLGNSFSSIREMCRHYGIARGTFQTRLRRGWSLEDALTKAPIDSQDKGNRYYDKDGKEYTSLRQMADEYGINTTTLRYRLNKGVSIEELLHKKIVKDHLGNEYKSEREMCRHYGILINTYKDRIKKGWTIEEALTKPMTDAREINGIAITDHLGKEYKSEREMCLAYDIDRGTFRYRIKTGMSIEEALTTETITTDHNGNEYKSELAMCRAYGIDNSTFRYRRREGFSIEEALTIPKHYSLGEYRVAKVLDKFCEDDEGLYYLHNIQIKKLFEWLNQEKLYHKFMDKYEEALLNNNINISKRRLAKFRFDFSVIKDEELFAFIEYDGIQHFKFVDLFFKTFEEFYFGITRDAGKNVFAEENRIPLLRIRYDQIDEKSVVYMVKDLLDNPQKYIYDHNTFLSNEEYLSGLEDSDMALIMGTV